MNLSLSLTNNLSMSSGSAAFSPASLPIEAWWDASDLSTIFTTSAGSTPSAINDPIGRIEDKSGNARHLVQGTAGSRPTLQATGMDFDGTDDGLATASGQTWAATTDIWLVMDAEADQFITLWDATNAASEAMGISIPTDGTAVNVGVGAPTIHVDGAAVADVRDDFYHAIRDTATPKIVEFRGCSMAFSQFAIGNYGGGFTFNGQKAEIIVAETLSAGERTALYAYLEAKWL